MPWSVRKAGQILPATALTSGALFDELKRSIDWGVHICDRSLPAGRALMGGHGRVLTALPPAQLPMANSTHAMAVEVVRGA